MLKLSFISPFLLTVCIFFIFEACSTDPVTHSHISFESIKASSIIRHNDQFIVVGTAKDTFSLKKDIQSPFVMVFDSTLTKTKQCYFPTSTTSLEPIINVASPSQYILSFYRAKSLKDQSEISQLLYLNTNFKTIKEISFGNRTRINDLTIRNPDIVITLNYERSTQDNTIQFVKNKTLDQQITYAVSEETNIPTDLLVTDQEIFIAGIANGFHYPDGHEYKEPETYGYIIRTDLSGNEKNRYTHHGDGHVFIHALSQSEQTIQAIGTYQSAETSMDLLLLTLDIDLNLLYEYIFKESGVQEGLIVTSKDNRLYVAGRHEDSRDHTMNIQLHCIDANHNQFIWEKTIKKKGTQKPTDIIISKNQLILLSQSQASRIASPESYITIFSLDGEFILETKIH